ncbi:TPA: hypothetical protein ACJIK4_001821 [Kluyvera cryocrescens]
MFYCDLPQIFGPDPLYKQEEGIEMLKKNYGITAPQQIFEQIYCGLCTNEDFQHLYGHLKIESLRWDLVRLPTAVFAEVRRNSTFPDYVLEVSDDYKNCGAQFRIDGREEVAEHWEKHGTWDEPPMFIDRSLVYPGENGLHLMEGHTRLGTLLGAINYGFVKLADMHQIYLAIKNRTE